MNNWLTKSATEMAAGLAAGEVTATQLVEASLERIAAVNPQLNAFLALDPQGALDTAAEVDRIRAEGGELHPYAGVPVAVKDNIVTQALETTAASNILAGWEPPYDATVVERLREALIPVVGKTNLDEFAMGSSTATSAFGPTWNPWGEQRVPGGSGGGSAAAVAAYLVPWALGTDTGGSIRQPGAFTGTVGVKPTYGAVSRHGAVALASSLDQIGPVARTVQDAAALQDIISGHDPKDATSLPQEPSQIAQVLGQKGPAEGPTLKVGVIEELSTDVDQAVAAAFQGTVDKLREAGAQVDTVSLPALEYAPAVYQAVMSAEAFSNLGRFDGVRFGTRYLAEEGQPETAETMTTLTRGEGFGDEVKRRVLFGAWLLSAEQHEIYQQALQARTLVTRELLEELGKVDVLISPTVPTVAWRTSEEPQYRSQQDRATIPANLAGVPAVTVPNGLADGLPTGVEIMAGRGEDQKMYQVAALVEQLVAGDVSALPWDQVEEGQ